MNSIEWLKKELESYGTSEYLYLNWSTFDELCEQAKEKHKKEQENSFFAGIHCTGEGWNAEYANGNNPDVGTEFKEDFEQYYQETFEN